jgi:hypothetical protein
MPHGGDVHDTLVIVHGIDHSMFANADAPKVLFSLQFPTSGRARLFRQSFYLRENSLDGSSLKRFEFSSR